MPELTKFCFQCGQQNNLNAQFCQGCGMRYERAQAAPPSDQPKQYPKPNNAKAFAIPGLIFLVCVAVIALGEHCERKRQTQTLALMGNPSNFKPAPTPTPAPTAKTERLVLEDTYVSVYVECTNREWKQYKFRFIVKRSGSPLLTPILRQVGNPNAYSVVVNGVDTGDGDLAFSPNIAAFGKNGELITTEFQTRPLNGNEALGRSYYNLIAKYERGD